MSLTYTLVGWADSPSTASPMDAANFSHMDSGISAATTQINTNTTAIAGKVDGTHGFYNGFKLYVAHTLPASGMAKGDVCVLTPFS